MSPSFVHELFEHFPMTPTGDVEALLAYATEVERRELGGSPS